MGYGLPAAIGAQVAHPDDQVILHCWRWWFSNEYSRIRNSSAI